MPAEIKPLFRPNALRPKLNGYVSPAISESASANLTNWSSLLGSKQAEGMKETELLGDFIRDVFVNLLGYVPPPAHPSTLKREALVKVDGKFADAGFGHFDGDVNTFAAVLEGKGPRDPLDRPFAGRKRSAVEQALQYAVQLQIDWYLVTNLKEIRLYHKGHDTFTYERFETARLAKEAAELKRFVYILGAERLLGPSGNHLDNLLTESKKIGRELTNDFYREYRALRERTFEALKEHNTDKPAPALLAATQKMLDRVLFIAFCEDRGLLPRDIIARAYEHSDPFNPRPIWDNFVGLFRSINGGNDRLNIAKYNGGLFAADPLLEGLAAPDSICEGFKKLADYGYGNDPDADAKLIDVEILGHIFEQSISDLEEMQNKIAGRITETKAKEQRKSSRKEAGAFYTPAFITRHIVAAALGPVVAARFERRRAAHEANAPKTVKKVLADPTVFDPRELTKPRTAALLKFWQEWIDELPTVRIVDPACGSGAFLIEAFDQLFAEYQKAQGFLTELQGPTLFDIRKTILETNLYGVDLNGEAVEIARLSCWIKTAELGKILTSLDHNIREGNSVITDPTVHPKAFDWQAAFPEVFAAGGFDVVVGNPPYVRQEWIKDYKPHWEKRFQSYYSTADLFVYFYELGLKLLKPNGRLGYVTSGGWVRGSYGQGLRGYLAKNAGLESMIDFGEYQPFEDAEMIRPTIAILSKRLPGGPMRLWKWLTNGKPPENLAEVVRAAPLMRTDHLGAETWELEADDVIELRKKLVARGKPLREFHDTVICYGIKTGLNEVFVIDAKKRAELIEKDSKSAEIIKPFVQGTNLRPWYVENSASFLIFSRRGIRIEDYPAVLEYLAAHKENLQPKPDDWPERKEWKGRKAGSYLWYEIQDSVDYWPAFEQPKIVWPDITNYPRFSMDHEKWYLGNTGYVIPGGDYYLLGVLSSWASWFFISKTAQPLRLRSGRWQYRLIAQFMENIPIPDAPPVERGAIATLAEQCNALGMRRYQLEEIVRQRLTRTFGIDGKGQPLGKLNEKAQEWWNQPANGLGDALKQSFKLKRNPFTNPTTADEWDSYLTGKKAEVDTLQRQLADAEVEINDRVYKLFSLTGDEIKLLQEEVAH